MSKSIIFFWCILSFVVGIFLRSFFPETDLVLFPGTIVIIICFALGYRDKQTLLVVGCSACLLFGIWRLDSVLIKRDERPDVGKQIKELVRVISQPQTKGNYQNVTAWLEHEDKNVIFSMPLTRDVFMGDTIEIQCVLQKPENSDAFDYEKYLEKEDISYICDKAKIISLTRGSAYNPFFALHGVRAFFQQHIYELIPQPEGALASGLIFGGGDDISENVKNDFSRTGMTHIVAVSGFNVTIVAEYLILLGISMGLWRKHALIFAICGIVAFVIMVGLPASAVRAGVMGSIIIWAMYQGRLATSENAILLAGALMLVANPMLLRWDVGFQLSFLATMGVVVVSKIWNQCSFSQYSLFGLTELIVLTLGAQLFVFPIIAYNFQTFSTISLLANMLILPIIPASMLLVFLVAITSFMYPVSLVFAWLAFLPLKFEMTVIQFLSNISWSSLHVSMSAFFVFVYYLVLAGIIFIIRRRQAIFVS